MFVCPSTRILHGAPEALDVRWWNFFRRKNSIKSKRKCRLFWIIIRSLCIGVFSTLTGHIEINVKVFLVCFTFFLSNFDNIASFFFFFNFWRFFLQQSRNGRIYEMVDFWSFLFNKSIQSQQLWTRLKRLPVLKRELELWTKK